MTRRLRKLFAALIAVGAWGGVAFAEDAAADSRIDVLCVPYPQSHIFHTDAIVLPTQLINRTDAPINCAVTTALTDYRPNEATPVLAKREQSLTLAPGVPTAAPRHRKRTTPNPCRVCNG